MRTLYETERPTVIDFGFQPKNKVKHFEKKLTFAYGYNRRSTTGGDDMFAFVIPFRARTKAHLGANGALTTCRGQGEEPMSGYLNDSCVPSQFLFARRAISILPKSASKPLDDQRM
jgi:hypothetical protein